MSTINASLPKTLAGVTNEIKRCLDAIQSNSMRAGRLLQSAKDMHASGNEWLAWAKAEFGLAKAQVYKLVKVYTVFGEDARFEGVAMRVLYLLASEANAEQIELAAKAAEEGMLDSAFAARMLHPEKAAPAPAPEAPAAQEQGEDSKEEETSPKAPEVPETANAPVDNGDAPWNDEGNEVQEVPAAPAAPKALDKVEPAGYNESLSELVAEIKLLREQLANKDALISQLQGESKRAPVLPTMPHLYSEHAYIVLGVVPDADKIFAGHRARDLLKMFKGNKEACDLIAAAAKVFKEA